MSQEDRETLRLVYEAGSRGDWEVVLRGMHPDIEWKTTRMGTYRGHEEVIRLFEDLREPLSELNKLRGMTPRAALTKHLLDGDDSIFTGKFDKPEEKPVSSPALQPVAPPEPPATTPFDTDAT